jgi:hypothetical protein
MASSLRRTVRRVCLRLLTLLLFFALAYFAWGWFTLHRKLTALGPGGRTVSYELAAPADTPLATSWPFVVRANVKQEGAQDWLPAGKAGLVEKRFAWSPGSWQWVEDPPPPLAPDVLLRLELLAKMPPPSLIEALTDADPLRREVAGRALRLIAGQDFGYRFDGPPERQVEAAGAYRKWWEASKVRYARDKVEQLEKVFKGPEAPAR